MNFFKQAQELAASANVNTENQQGGAAPTAGAGGLGGFMSEAQDMMKSQGAPAATGQDTTGQSAGAPATLPGGRQAPTNAQLLESSKLLFGAAQGQQVDNKRLAGAAEDLLGGLAAHGKLDQGQYGTYVNQAENYLHKYAGADAAPAASAAAAAPAPGAAVRAAAPAGPPAAAGPAPPPAAPASAPPPSAADSAPPPSAADSAPMPASDNAQY